MKKEKHLKHLMEMKSGSVKAFSKDIGLAYTTVRSILERGVFNAKVDNVIKICKGLNIKPENLMDLDDTIISESITTLIKLAPPRQKRVLDFANEQLNEQNNKVLHINSHNVISEEVAVYGYASAGTGETLIDGVEFTTQYNGHIPNHDFALQVNGDSMEPMFEDKEIIFIDKTKQINSGQIGIFVIDGEAYLKKVFINEEGIRLVSLNSKYPDLFFDKNHDIKVAGKVIL
ncbi:XRE family transcriptional regulator [Staphylococcus pseudintermedius]|uniref:helix-turn-helix domain-containing protein n=1 Tax=Staphylococcus pseudintermedius TaxID=283734 RepID=UPI0018E15B2C|nr:XRE family transcriptional regulator [Staphylococcus pseudintermedius]EGQ2787397.1 helix-turn-helix transcriptional regulator [Staphylococcus pseudintermedius]EGQ3673054.1 helix-turn-helix transcriptional regulator [Staphylococcus pseudintermedius]EGQ3723969.1 helix-turn-helix transcriptional regulator [Staphylococcus pseudintermedius]EIO0096417.1 helix-turn-helix transcriptional regulator [Staphylococcus pseudintermedius]MDF0338647.1 XRE family transcriptional regulator [Staphylococcus pse